LWLWLKIWDRLPGQLTETGINGIRIEYEGDVAEMNVKALTSAALTGVLRPAASGCEHGLRARDRQGAWHQGGRSASPAAGHL
jgi:hypothetical protein